MLWSFKLKALHRDRKTIGHMRHFLNIVKLFNQSDFLTLAWQNFSWAEYTSVEVYFDSFTGENVLQQLILSEHIKNLFKIIVQCAIAT